MEDNLSSVLKIIEKSGEQQRLFIFAETFKDFAMITLNIERILKILYGTQLERKDGPGHFLIKLLQVLDDVCPLRKASGVKSTRMAQELGALEAGDAQLESDGVQLEKKASKRRESSWSRRLKYLGGLFGGQRSDMPPH